jgi:nucleotide-binding universal stress UspA family protein
MDERFCRRMRPADDVFSRHKGVPARDLPFYPALLLSLRKGASMFHTILTPLDGSAFGEYALPLALGIARRSGAGLRLLHVVPPPASLYSENPLFIEDSRLESYVREHYRSAGLYYLGAVAHRLKGLAAPGAARLVVEGEVRDAIRAQAELGLADLVVMTTHGRGPLGRFWLGSAADELVRTLSMPVLLVRPGEGLPDLEREPNLKRILIALDGSALAEQVLAPAVEIGRLMGAELTLLRVVRPVLLPQYALEGGGVGQIIHSMEKLDAGQKNQCEQAEKYLEAIAAPLRAQGLAVRTRVVVEEQPAVGVLQEAQNADADLIALATHGRRGLSRLFLGSVADKVVRGGRRPVLLVRPKEMQKE